MRSPAPGSAESIEQTNLERWAIKRPEAGQDALDRSERADTLRNMMLAYPDGTNVVDMPDVQMYLAKLEPAR